MKHLPLFAALVAALLITQACDQPRNPSTGQTLDTPTTGDLNVLIDEGYKPVVESAIDVFDSIYRQARVHARYVSEGEAVAAIIRDSVQVIVIPRKLTEDELKYFRQRGFTPKMTPIAHDAVAFILNPSNMDSVFTREQLRDLMTGKTANWSDLNPKSKLGPVRLVFDNALSGTVKYVKDTIGGGAPLPPNASALNTNEEVIAYVAKNPAAVGIISANIISDTDDGGVQKFLSEIKLLRVSQAAGEHGYGPFQAYLATGQYPYKRTIYVINAQARPGLGLGFASYLAGDGQRLILKEGMLPANAVTRLIEVQR